MSFTEYGFWGREQGGEGDSGAPSTKFTSHASHSLGCLLHQEITRVGVLASSPNREPPKSIYPFLSPGTSPNHLGARHGEGAYKCNGTSRSSKHHGGPASCFLSPGPVLLFVVAAAKDLASCSAAPETFRTVERDSQGERECLQVGI